MTKNFLYTILLSVTNILFPLISFPYASRILGPEGIGKVQLIVSLSQYFALFAALGIPIYGITQAARYKGDPKKLSVVFAELTSIYLVASIICFTLYLAVVFTVPFFFKNQMLYIYGGSLILLSFCNTDWFYSGIEEFRIITIRSIVVKLTSLALLYLFVKSEYDFHIYLFIILFSILGNQLFSFIDISRKTNFRFEDLNIKKHLKPLFYIFSAGIAASIYTVLDTILLGIFSNEHAVGLYTASAKIVRITFPFVTAMGTILTPAISKSFANNDLFTVRKYHFESLQFLTFITIPACVGFALLSPEFILIFSGEKFSGAGVCMQILSVLPILVGFGHFFHVQVLIPSGKNKEVFLSMLAGVLTCLLMNYLLVPQLKEIGASIATVTTEIIVNICYAFFIVKYFKLEFKWKFLAHSILASLPFIPAVLLIRQTNLGNLSSLSLSVLSCAVIYVCIHLFVFKNYFLLNFVQPLRQLFFVKKTEPNE